ncbi:MAG: endonuclease/exonuclease/phosphatase family protein [Aquabacterium sp.]|uniref:hypothetical protein n=1 Tax=Aquabacterium sp. TaxID=1872578 RepID=UPI0025BA6356|nr:hypothetical protein [Aquabacterium sp.]MBI3381402.1 endonuclease/exonuclease/phosphatase family protein [Aquabacterium sp.]
MVVVSWNMAKSKGIPIEHVLAMCERWGASVLVIQEPTGSLLDFGSRRNESQPRGCKSTWRGTLQKGGSQGSIVIVARDGVKISNVSSVDLGVGQGTRQITATNPLVLFDAQEGGERMKIGTCHAPFDESARASFAGKAVENCKKRKADCLLGDMNTYGTAVPGATRSRGGGFQAPSLGATSARGRGSPLDKVFVSDSVGPSFQAGRIVPGKTRVSASPKGSDRVKDVVDPKWSECRSDHLPIYIAFHDQVGRVNDLFPEDDDSDDEDDPGPPSTKRTKRDGEFGGGTPSVPVGA